VDYFLLSYRLILVEYYYLLPLKVTLHPISFHHHLNTHWVSSSILLGLLSFCPLNGSTTRSMTSTFSLRFHESRT
jgi:hypothetical protein